MEILDSPEGRSLRLWGVYGTVQEAIEQVNQIKDDKGINEIDVQGLEINGQLISCLSRLVKKDDRSWQELVLVDCPFVGLDDVQEKEFLDIVANFEHLYLQTNRQVPHAISQYILPIRGATKVSKLRLFIHHLDESLIRLLARCLSITKCTVKKLFLASGRCDFQAEMLAEAFQSNTSLENLRLQLHGWEPAHQHEGVYFLFRALHGHPKLQELAISKSDLSDWTLQALNDMIAHPNSPLEVVDLQTRHDPLAISLLAPAIAHNPPSLQQLKLSYCGLVDDQVFPLIDALTQNTHLETLTMSFNPELTDAFLIYLGHRRPRIRLTSLNLMYLHPSNGSAIAVETIFAGLRENTHLTIFLLEDCEGSFSAPRFLYYLNMNRGGRRALEERVPLTLWPLLLERAQNCSYFRLVSGQSYGKLDSMYYLLRNQPALWQQSNGE
jgi:hypothetical protein